MMQSATVRKFRTVSKDGNRMVKRNMDYYNLDMIINPLKSRIICNHLLLHIAR